MRPLPRNPCLCSTATQEIPFLVADEPARSSSSNPDACMSLHTSCGVQRNSSEAEVIIVFGSDESFTPMAKMCYIAVSRRQTVRSRAGQHVFRLSSYVAP